MHSAKGVRFSETDDIVPLAKKNPSPSEFPSPPKTLPLIGTYSPQQAPFHPRTPSPHPLVRAHPQSNAALLSPSDHSLEHRAVGLYSPSPARPVRSLGATHQPSPPHRPSAPRPLSSTDTPSPSHSVSTLSTQSGPYTPLHTNIPLTPSLEKYLPSPYEDGINRSLKYQHPKAISFDLVYPPPPIDDLTRTEFATESRTSTMRIECAFLSWSVDLREPTGSPLTVFHVLDGIYHSLWTTVTPAEYDGQPPSKRKDIAMAFYDRCERLPTLLAQEEEKKKGLRRVDWLTNNSRFIGLLPAEEPNTYTMFTGP